TDIHESSDAEMAAAYVDVLQIPAFLVRQTDLVVAAAKTGKTVNLKKGQFMSPESMKHAVQKVLDCNNENIMVTDRGTMFGYQDMIVDYRSIPTMQQYATTVLDITHSLQQPNQTSGVTGGRPDLIETIAKAGIAVGVDGIFIETHFDPKNAKSDGANMLHLDYFEPLMKKLVTIRQTVNQFNMKKISILGAGWLGGPLALQLKTKGHQVKVSTTTTEKLLFFKENNIDAFLITIGDTANNGLDQLLAETDLLIITVPPGRTQNVEKNYVDKIKYVLPFIEKHQIKEVIFTSSTTVYLSLRGMVDENTPIVPVSEMDRQIITIEQLLLNNLNFNASILRL